MKAYPIVKPLTLMSSAFLWCLQGCHPHFPQSPVYQLTHIAPSNLISIDGILKERAWKTQHWINTFSFPWKNQEAPETRFCAFNSGKHFYFAFQVKDNDLVISSSQKDGEIEVTKGDRVEIFFSKDKFLKNYYCLEINPRGHILDYHASSYRKFDTTWDCPGLLVSTQVLSDGYIVEGAIPHQTLYSLGLLDFTSNKPMLVGLFRAEFSHGERRKINENWVSWRVPNSEKPDFHIPSAFGYFHFYPPSKQE